jgi:arabinofuranosyltransferase
VNARFTLIALVLLVVGVLAVQFSLGLCIQEDAYISFRYARNLADGNGLVYNAGERVEGYSNFLWTVIMAAVIKLKLDPVHASRYLGIASALALLLFSFFAARRNDRPRRVTGGLVAGVIVASSSAVIVESVQGLETVFFTLLAAVGLVYSCRGHGRELRGESGGPPMLLIGSAFFVLAALTRPEGLGVFFLVTIAITLVRLKRGMKAASRAGLAAIYTFMAPWLLYWVLRYNYYGYPLPNTFYAKTGGGGHHMLTGLEYVGNFLLDYPALAVLTLAVCVLPLTAPRRKPGAAKPKPMRYSVVRPVLLTVLIGYTAYVVTVGGDFKMTHRFIIPVLPAWAYLVDDAISRGRWLKTGSRLSVATPWIIVVIMLLNGYFAFGDAREWAAKRTWDMQRRTAAGLYLAEHAPPGAVLAIHSAGIIPYVSGLKTIDMWGLNDLHIAHRKIHDMGQGRRIGHEKHDAPYVFSKWPTYHVDENFYVRAQPRPDLVRLIFTSPAAAPVANRYRARNVQVKVDTGSGPQTYYFNFLELKQ